MLILLFTKLWCYSGVIGELKKTEFVRDWDSTKPRHKSRNFADL
jgi:hypothetical protein